MTCYPVLYKGMIMLPISAEHCLHIHHWMCYLPLCLSCIALAHVAEEEDKRLHDAHTIPTLALIVAAGFTMIMTLHGLLMYTDRFIIKVPNPYQRGNNHAQGEYMDISLPTPSLSSFKALEQQKVS